MIRYRNFVNLHDDDINFINDDEILEEEIDFVENNSALTSVENNLIYEDISVTLKEQSINNLLEEILRNSIQE